MSFEIKYGLFKLNITDHHAILGASLDANPQKIRLHYLKIAQKLHPDKCRSDPNKAKAAGAILSKLVNPAYEQLSRKNAFAEHQLVLTQIGRRLAENKAKVTVTSELARELLKAGDSAELVYSKLLKKLTNEQYKSLDEVKQQLGEISELNLVYLMLKSDRALKDYATHKAYPKGNRAVEGGSQQATAIDNQTVSQQATVAKSSTTETTSTEEPSTESRVTAFVNRAQQYITKGEYDRAIQELRDALRIESNHGVAHAVMGKVYLHKKQLTMAKVHISKACKADPHNKVVMESKKILNKMTTVANKSKVSDSGSAKDSGSKSTGGGFFSGLFGSKKK